MGDYPERSDSEDEHYGGFTGGGSDTLNNNTRKVRHNIVSLFHDEEFRKKITDENEQEFVNIFFYLIQNKKLNPYERYFYEEFYAYHTMEEDANIQQITEEDVNKLVEYYEGRLGLEGKSKISFPFHNEEMDVILLLKKGEENETNNEGEEQNNNQETEDQIQGQKMVFKKLQKMYAYLNGIVDEKYEPSDVDFLDDNCKNTDSMDGKIKCIEDKILAKITEINEKNPDVNASIEGSKQEPEKKLDDMKKKILENKDWGNELLSSAKIWKDEIIKNFSFPVQGDSHILSIIVGQEEKAIYLQKYLEENGFLAIAIRPPTVPVGKSRIRITIRRNLDFNLLKNFIAVLKKFK